MMLQKEIELKIHVGVGIESVRSRLHALGCREICKEEHEDTYYTSVYRDLIQTRECLRIRLHPQSKKLTWKPPSSNAMRKSGQYWKQEVDVDITGQLDEVRQLLQGLGFIEYVTVKKRRIAYSLDDRTTVALDFVDPLGWFVEIETMAESPEYGTKRNTEVASLLGLRLEQRVHEPYRDLVKAGKIE